MKALLIRVGVDQAYGGWNAPNIVVAPNSGPLLFILGLVIMALYFPLYFWRKYDVGQRLSRRGPGVPQPVAATAAAPEMAGEES